MGGTDPSGYFNLRRALSALDDSVRDPFNASKFYSFIRTRPDGGAHDRFMMNNEWARTLGHAAAGTIPVVGMVVNAAISGYEVWLQGGSQSDIGKAWLISLGTYYAFQAVDNGSGLVSDNYGATAGDAVYIAGYAVVGCASADASGGSCERGALSSGASAAARVYYRSFTGRDATLKRGENRSDSINIACKDSGSNCFNFDETTGYIPESFGNGNAIGLSKELTGNFWDDFGKQSGPLSGALNVIPGVNAVAVFHDTIFGTNGISFNLATNVGTMIPAAMVTYSALINGTTSVELEKKRNTSLQNREF